jgi:hypothetical protein
VADPAGTVRPDFLDTADPFPSLHEAQAAVDAYVLHYNTDRPSPGLALVLRDVA